ncbi:solute carrier family 22 member 3-like [Acanthaster planci]|uniref:Solute carrier family 22 member 3-like n=1 Tax=Acanthaster planci TaxID=133434 RepID=A0A8B7XWF7_ACAPL|nr:solute carrier family 22 member 3-like [Acanthaster planci]
MVSFGHVFFAAENDHWCQVLPAENCSNWVEFQDKCTNVKKSILLPPPENENSKYPHSNCKQWDLPPGYEFDPYDPLSQGANFTNDTVPCQDGWEYDTSQYKTTIISEFDLVCDKRSLPSLAQSIYFVGFLVGSFLCGSLSDWIGRKKTAFVALLFFSVGSIVTTFSVNIYMYMAFRFMAGFGNIGSYIPLFVQESVNWLVSKGRIEEANKVVRRVAMINGKALPDVLFDKEDMEETESSVPPSFIDLFKTPNMAAKTINMMFNWMVTTLIYYGLSLSTGDLGVDEYWAFFVSGAVEIPAILYATFAIEWFGRKLNVTILEVIGGVACLANIFIPLGIWRTVVSMAGKFCITATFSIIYLYVTELFPTPVR